MTTTSVAAGWASTTVTLSSASLSHHLTHRLSDTSPVASVGRAQQLLSSALASCAQRPAWLHQEEHEAGAKRTSPRKGDDPASSAAPRTGYTCACVRMQAPMHTCAVVGVCQRHQLTHRHTGSHKQSAGEHGEKRRGGGHQETSALRPTRVTTDAAGSGSAGVSVTYQVQWGM